MGASRLGLPEPNPGSGLLQVTNIVNFYLTWPGSFCLSGGLCPDRYELVWLHLLPVFLSVSNLSGNSNHKPPKKNNQTTSDSWIQFTTKGSEYFISFFNTTDYLIAVFFRPKPESYFQVFQEIHVGKKLKSNKSLMQSLLKVLQASELVKTDPIWKLSQYKLWDLLTPIIIAEEKPFRYVEKPTFFKFITSLLLNSSCCDIRVTDICPLFHPASNFNRILHTLSLPPTNPFLSLSHPILTFFYWCTSITQLHFFTPHSQSYSSDLTSTTKIQLINSSLDLIYLTQQSPSAQCLKSIGEKTNTTNTGCLLSSAEFFFILISPVSTIFPVSSFVLFCRTTDKIPIPCCGTPFLVEKFEMFYFLYYFLGLYTCITDLTNISLIYLLIINMYIHKYSCIQPLMLYISIL
ncbi:hypothetical protein VP01_955g1 [Puccinia sorghi]|uniref:Uncharacterized protein n=1 Tax=Puccinia sorghi TaxID=27349 RepID=A0A0L6U694_9BASI|nr:hypothetical protein VP01_955g1 [Puccinia sorghi]